MPFKQKPVAHSKVDNKNLSFEQVYKDYFNRVYAYVASRLENQRDAEDIVADIFLRAMERFSQYRGGNLSSWLFTIAHNTLSDTFRKRKIVFLELEDDTLSDHETLEQSLLLSESRAEILKHIQSLSLRRQEVITLRFYGQLRNQEIAEVLGINEQSVASHLHRALMDLRARLAVLSPDQVE